MIDIVTAASEGAKSKALEDMYRLRHRVFKERLRWDVQSKNGMERDEYDDLDAAYLLAYDDSDTLRGTWRLLPTTGRYMLRDVFAELMGDQPLPADRSVWEVSRFAVEPEGSDESEDMGLASLNRTCNELFCAIAEFGLANGITEIVSAYDIRIARLLKRIDCLPFWQGRPRRIGNTIAVAGRFEISWEALAKVRRVGGFNGSVVRNVVPIAIPDAA
jgi:acyl homoserine lactone synthase